MFDPARLLGPDAQGYFYHPDLPVTENLGGLHLKCEQAGYSTDIAVMEDDAPEGLWERFLGNPDGDAVAQWVPSSQGEDWQLVAKLATPVGPVAVLVKPRVASALADLGVPEDRGWAVTDDLAEALAGGYIGEVPMNPRPLSDAVHQLFSGKPLRKWVTYYFGARDVRLSALFGYDD